MNEELKRRAFLAGIIGTLIGTPLAARFLLRGEPDESHRFTADLNHYQKGLDLPIKVGRDRGAVSLMPTPPSKAECKYVLFSQSVLPSELSRATVGEPDTFLVREGNLFFGTTGNGRSLIGGGDTLCRVCSPIGTDDRAAKTVMLLCDGGYLKAAKPKGGTAKPRPDGQFLHLLTLENSGRKELTVNQRWRSALGRVKPFNGYTTEYTVAGFAEIAGRPAVEIAFSGTVSNLSAPLPEHPNGNRGNALQKGRTAPLVGNRHDGHAWFDLETGFLLRQETETEAVASGIPGYKGRDGSDSITVKTHSILHLFTA